MISNTTTSPALMIVVRGTPQARPSARPGGHVARMLSPRLKLWRQAVERAARAAVENGAAVPRGAVRIELVFKFGTEKRERWGKLHTQKPDFDNLSKPVVDSMVRGGALGGDDARAALADVRKLWCPPHEAGMVALVSEAAEAPVSVGGGASAPEWLMAGQEGCAERG